MMLAGGWRAPPVMHRRSVTRTSQLLKEERGFSKYHRESPCNLMVDLVRMSSGRGYLIRLFKKLNLTKTNSVIFNNIIIASAMTTLV